MYHTIPYLYIYTLLSGPLGTYARPAHLQTPRHSMGAIYICTYMPVCSILARTPSSPSPRIVRGPSDLKEMPAVPLSRRMTAMQRTSLGLRGVLSHRRAISKTPWIRSWKPRQGQYLGSHASMVGYEDPLREAPQILVPC